MKGFYYILYHKQVLWDVELNTTFINLEIALIKLEKEFYKRITILDLVKSKKENQKGVFIPWPSQQIQKKKTTFQNNQLVIKLKDIYKSEIFIFLL